MKLLLHNLLDSKFLKGVQNGFPLILRATRVEKLELDANSDACEQFVRQMMPRLDYKVFRTASEAVEPALCSKLPADLPQEWEKDSEFMKNVYSLLVGYEVVEGELECPETQRVFPITEGIPNMLVRAEEVAES